MTVRCAVLGSPIAHSLSPVMHRAAYAELGLDDWTYDAVEVTTAGLADLVRDLGPEWRGLSLTMPLKRDVLALVDEASEVAAELGVANTVVLERGRRIASNTDEPGVTAALVERGLGDVRSVRVLGAGATAASAVHALTHTPGVTVEVVVRDASRATELVALAERADATVHVRELGAPMVDKVDLLVSTVPAEAVGADAHDLVDSARAVFDVVYDPWRTPLDLAAQERGRAFVSGLDLLAHQAELQVEAMTGRTVEAAVLRDAALRELRRRTPSTAS